MPVEGPAWCLTGWTDHLKPSRAIKTASYPDCAWVTWFPFMTWFPADGAIWEGLGDMTLLKEAGLYLGQALRFPSVLSGFCL